MMIEAFYIGLALATVLVSCLAAFFAIDAKIEVEAMKRSTHSIQYVPADQLTDFSLTDEAISKQPPSELSESQRKALTKDPFEEL